MGINGNDDYGQMSAWYVFGVMGFYLVTPGSEVFALGAPQFPEFTMKLSKDGNPKSFKIKANNLPEENMYIQSVTLDGTRINTPFITYTQITDGKELVFEMDESLNHHAFKM